MSATVSTQAQRIEAAAKTKKIFFFKLFLAICWFISATVMWVSYEINPSAIIAGAIAFSGIAVVYIARAVDGYVAYAAARNASITHK